MIFQRVNDPNGAAREDGFSGLLHLFSPVLARFAVPEIEIEAAKGA
jgi:hypothetical protein